LWSAHFVPKLAESKSSPLLALFLLFIFLFSTLLGLYFIETLRSIYFLPW